MNGWICALLTTDHDCASVIPDKKGEPVSTVLIAGPIVFCLRIRVVPCYFGIEAFEQEGFGPHAEVARTSGADVLDGSAFSTMSKCHSEGAEEALVDRIIDLRRLLQHDLQKKVRICFRSRMKRQTTPGVDRHVLRQTLFKVDEGDSALEALLQSCGKFLKDNGVRKPVTLKLSIHSSAKPKHKAKRSISHT